MPLIQLAAELAHDLRLVGAQHACHNFGGLVGVTALLSASAPGAAGRERIVSGVPFWLLPMFGRSYRRFLDHTTCRSRTSRGRAWRLQVDAAWLNWPQMDEILARYTMVRSKENSTIAGAVFSRSTPRWSPSSRPSSHPKILCRYERMAICSHPFIARPCIALHPNNPLDSLLFQIYTLVNNSINLLDK